MSEKNSGEIWSATISEHYPDGLKEGEISLRIDREQRKIFYTNELENEYNLGFAIDHSGAVSVFCETLKTALLEKHPHELRSAANFLRLALPPAIFFNL